MRYFSAIALFFLGVGIVASIITHSSFDMQSGDWFLPAPRSVNNLLGPFGAWLAMHLIALSGFFSIALGLISILWAVGRFLKWNTIILAKITGLVLGWIISISLPIAAIGGDYREPLLGKFGELLDFLLSYTGSVGKIFVSLAIFFLWTFLSTGIGLRRPLNWTINSIGALMGFAKSVKSKRHEKLKRERQKIIDQHHQRQEQVHRRIASSRTGNIVPGQLPEELLTPPAKSPALEQESKKMALEPQIEKTSAGLQDIAFTPPPILVPREEPKTPTKEEQKIPQSVAPPFQPAEAHEEIIVPTTEHSKQPQQQPPVEESMIQAPTGASSDEIPPWLMTDVQASSDAQPAQTLDESETPTSELQIQVVPPAQEPQELQIAPTAITKMLDGNIQVIEPAESPGLEIDAVEKEEQPIETAYEEDEEIIEDAKEDALALTEAPFSFPTIDILTPALVRSQKFSEEELQNTAKNLFEALKTFRVDGTVTAITPGPIITRYEVEPAPGVKISRIAQLADDLALALKVRDVMITPVPGKGTIGIEVPNAETEAVYVRSVLESPAFANTKASLPMALGKGIAGEPIVADLAKMPHLLIAGATGSGKSVCINTILTSLIFKKTPMELRLLMIDPKRLELSIYDGIPFLIGPVVVENKEASAALNWVLIEMERRYRVLADARVRSLAEYNSSVQRKPETGAPLPFIVVVVDELADLMMTVANEIEEPIARLAQMSRAVGIHLILATQRPSVDVVTGIIKANFPSRIAFKVRSKIDSRTILDMNGADRLLGMGDMLYLPSGFSEPIRIHGSFISTEETEKLVNFLKNFQNPQKTTLSFKEEVAQRASSQERDELFWEAAKIIVMSQKGSASHLQRKLRIGYTRAASLIDQLESAGIVGPFEGSKAREVSVKTLEELDKMKAGSE